MNAISLSDLDQFREGLLREAKEYLRDRHLRTLWRNKKWPQSFIEIEDARDEDFRNRIDDAQQDENFDKVSTLRKYHYDALKDDIGWYSEFKNELDALREAWEHDQAFKATAAQQFADYQDKIAYRLCERQVVLQQLVLDRLEELRYLGEFEPTDDWLADWEELRAAFVAQRDAYRQDLEMQSWQAIRGQWLRWCLALRAQQQLTGARLNRGQKDEHMALQAAMKSVDELIAELQPRREPWINWSAVIGVCVLAAIIIGILLVLNDNISRPEHQQTAEMLYIRANKLLKENNCKDAIAVFEQAIAADPSAHLPRNDMAFCLYELDRRDEAIAQWREAIRLRPDRQDAHAGLGMALYQEGRHEEGLARYRCAIALGGDYLKVKWMREDRKWSAKALTDSRELRAQLEQYLDTVVPHCDPE